MKMKIGVYTDLRFTALDNPTGVTKHIVNVINNLYEDKNFELIILAARDQLTAEGEIPKENALAFLTVRPLPHTWKEIYWKSLLFPINYYDQYSEDLDLVYSPKNDYLPLKQTKFISTFHGAHEIDPDYPNPTGLLATFNRWRSKKNYQNIIDSAYFIFTVSEFLKDKTLEIFRTNPLKIKVIGNGVEEIFFKKSLEHHYDFNKPFIAVGGINYMDGGDRLIRIAKRLVEKGSERKILVAGNQHEKSLLKAAKELKNIELLGYLKKEELANLMANASALLFFTTYETFGIAAVEALAVGLPVVTRTSTAVPEILETSAFYLPEDFDDLESILDEKTRVLQIIKEGKKRAENFHWQDCADRIKTFIEADKELNMGKDQLQNEILRK